MITWTLFTVKKTWDFIEAPVAPPPLKSGPVDGTIEDCVQRREIFEIGVAEASGCATREIVKNLSLFVQHLPIKASRVFGFGINSVIINQLDV
jgi:hypothetical protein